MTNENCLEGIRCPQCGQDDRFKITAIITCEVTDEGSEPIGDHCWDDDSFTRCCDCGQEGPLKTFRPTKKLPPDPDGLNGKRADWAGAALNAFMAETGTDKEDALADLLTDLLHWCDRNEYDFRLALDRAMWHYDAETGGEDS